MEDFRAVLAELGWHPDETYRFPDSTQKVILGARRIAEELKSASVGSEHMLLALMKDKSSLPARTLERLNVDSERVQEQVVRIIGEGPDHWIGPYQFTPNFKTAVRQAMREPLSSGSQLILPHHLLLGMMKILPDDGVAPRVLLDFDVDAQKVQTEVNNLLGDKQREPEHNRGEVVLEPHREIVVVVSKGYKAVQTTQSRPDGELEIRIRAIEDIKSL
jgi:ATP-dependent Clp protease ATP-binding subunit ClpC